MDMSSSATSFVLFVMVSVILLATNVGCDSRSNATDKSHVVLATEDRSSDVMRVLEAGGATVVEMATASSDPPRISNDYELPSGEVLSLTFAPIPTDKSSHVLERIRACHNADQPKAHRQYVSVKEFRI